ncbi:MAG TPA: hypothetical protein VLM86_02050 [Candidatus Bathyarchaeia archaeon]|nr:hypothetical protein [Candidatus Bathyarchaeia archaeon]
MIKVKTFSSQLKIFHTRNELLELDQAVNDFVASRGIRKVISVSDAVTTGEKGEAIGVVRVVAYDEPGAGPSEKVLGRMERKLDDWGGEVEKLRGKVDKLGSEAKGKFQEQAEELRVKQESARQKLHELRKAGGEAWEDLQGGAEAALDDLKKTLDKVVKKWKR